MPSPSGAPAPAGRLPRRSCSTRDGRRDRSGVVDHDRPDGRQPDRRVPRTAPGRGRHTGPGAPRPSSASTSSPEVGPRRAGPADDPAQRRRRAAQPGPAGAGRHRARAGGRARHGSRSRSASGRASPVRRSPAPPARSSPLPAFRTDRLDEAWGQTDLAVQICADDPLTVAHARRMILKDCAGFARLRWVQDGFRQARGTVPDGTTMRNVMGQVDGTVNPVEADPDFAGLIWSDDAGFAGGTFMVVRRIRARDGDLGQGRPRRPGGRRRAAPRQRRPADGHAPSTTSPTSRPRTPRVPRHRSGQPHRPRPQRRTRGSRSCAGSTTTRPRNPTRPTGEDSGLVFIAFAADVERQFVPVQRDSLSSTGSTSGSPPSGRPSTPCPPAPPRASTSPNGSSPPDAPA